MSEHLRNKEYKQEILKKLIQDLHGGKDPERVKEQFRELIRDVSAAEISEMEEGLIKGGLPVEEVKKLCDVHVEVFRESLDRAEKPEFTPGHPVYGINHENREAQRIIDRIDHIFNELNSADNTTADTLLSLLKEKAEELRDVEKHYLKKENILFPYLERHNITGPPSVMWGVHDDIRALFKKFVGLLGELDRDSYALRMEELAGIYRELKRMITEMFYKEEKILIPMLLDNLDNREWAEIKIQDEEFGVVFSRVEGEWSPGEGEIPEAPKTDRRDAGEAGRAIGLDVGYLTLQQLNLMLKTLPFDITFVDKDDRVAYFSEGRERIFPRTRAIIGRSVRNCHPPSSVHVVEKILTDFKTGRHDTAQFWIEMQGMFVHIRYFAVRDEEGGYMGTLEVTQNIADIRRLEGERRLLHYED